MSGGAAAAARIPETKTAPAVPPPVDGWKVMNGTWARLLDQRGECVADLSMNMGGVWTLRFEQGDAPGLWREVHQIWPKRGEFILQAQAIKMANSILALAAGVCA